MNFETIFSKSALEAAFHSINCNVGIDLKDKANFLANLSQNIESLRDDLLAQIYAPEPLLNVNLKTDSKIRHIGISTLKDKIVQKVLYDALNLHFDSIFSNRSYAYRRGKSTTKALNRASNYINEGYNIILKSDIKDFFECINQAKLIDLLRAHIKDTRLLELILLFVKNGSFKKLDYSAHELGIHQGDIISPFLSNLYLDSFDKFLEKENHHIRYGDDFVVFFKQISHAKLALNKIEQFLNNIDLKLNKEKTYIKHINEGFSFLGVEFKNRDKKIKESSLNKLLDKIANIPNERESFNQLLLTIKNHYFKVASKNDKIIILDSITRAISQIILQTRKHNLGKKNIKNLFANIKLELITDRENTLDSAFKLAQTKPSIETTARQKITKKANFYVRQFSSKQILCALNMGQNIGISKYSFVLKEFGKIIKKVPQSHIKRIIIGDKGIYISSNLIFTCAKNKIPIDFIDRRGNPYAQLLTYRSSFSQTAQNQSALLNTPAQLAIAREIIHSKLSNAANFIKLLARYHEGLDESINKIISAKNNLKKAKDIAELMGFEGLAASAYWQGISLVLSVPFIGRITLGARDVVNSSINYGYAILYGRIAHNLVRFGLNLSISFLHAQAGTKPTLVFDMIEEFRSFVVDRVIVSMFNKNEPLKIDKDGLTAESRMLIAKNINEKLQSYTTWHKQRIQIDNIIQTQASNLAKFVNGEIKSYKGFVGKF